jgi:anaerobic magnesium-protoporphyrin IX monomethyl ester cyclase
VVILYNPPSSANRKPVLPMSLLAVGAVLEGRHDYCIVDGNLEADPVETLEALIRQAGPQPVLGVTVMPGPQLEQAVPLCRHLKERHPRLTIVWGGYFPTQHWDVCLRSDFVDYVVRGHGEYTFLQLLDKLQGHLSPTPLPPAACHSLPGLAYPDADGEPTSNPLAPIPRPAQLPAWNFDRVPVERYVRRTFLGSRTLGYHTSYGCPFFCNFCAVVNMVNGRWLPQTAVQVADTAHMYRERWGVNAIEFYDNNFFTRQARVAEFAGRIMDLKLRWWGEGRIDTLLNYSDATWGLMRDAGLHMIFLGAESGSDETLQRMDKGGTMSAEKTLAIAHTMKQWHIIPEFSFVMGNPPDPERDVAQTMAFIRRVKQVNPQAEIVMYLYTPVPLAGDLYDEAQAEGFAFPETLEEWVSPAWLNFSQRRSATMPWLRQPLPDRLRDFERVLNAYYPTSTDANLTAVWRTVLRSLSAWRYHTGCYRFPLELRALQRLIAYQRPETSGF